MFYYAVICYTQKGQHKHYSICTKTYTVAGISIFRNALLFAFFCMSCGWLHVTLLLIEEQDLCGLKTLFPIISLDWLYKSHWLHNLFLSKKPHTG